MVKEIKNEEANNWKIVLIKTIENKEPIYYRVANLLTYEVEDIPAYRILDEVINKRKNIINLSCENNQIVVVNEDGYWSLDEVVNIDEFDTEIPDIMEFELRQGEESELLKRYDSDKNLFSPSNYKIDSTTKIAWTCDKEHTIKCSFPVFFSTKCKCPICEMEKQEKKLSLKYWANITDNLDILREYEDASSNKDFSDEISWNSKKKVSFNRNGEEVQEVLSNITVKKMEPPFSEKNKKQLINLTK